MLGHSNTEFIEDNVIVLERKSNMTDCKIKQSSCIVINTYCITQVSNDVSKTFPKNIKRYSEPKCCPSQVLEVSP